ncbi:MAG: NAD(P)-dependent oxidoreductase [Acidobacteriota bacterium]|nr:MAG: NAD(P)-dependent oxidoreductase [Acidobacteriota bacterium]
MTKDKVGFVGLGIMGLPMAANLAKAGFELTVYNRTPGRAEQLEGPTIRIAQSPAEVAEASDIIITIVSDSPDVEAVVLGPNGVIEGIRPGSILVDMSTISPAVERRIDQELQGKSCSLVDAPVSGGDIGAIKGTLAIMAGGERKSFERVLPLFEAMGKTITYCGPVGNGQLTKLCNQVLVSVNLLAVSEAVTFARKNGLDPATMIQAVAGGAAGSWQLSNLGPKIVDRDFAPGFMIDLMQKDLRLVLEAGDQAGVALAAAGLVHQFFNSAQAAGDGRAGTQALAKVIEKLSAV